MRRRVLMVLLWLAGTFGATSAVFATVTSVSNDLFNAGNPRNAAPEISRGSFGFNGTTTTAAPPNTTTVPTEAPTTLAETTTSATEPPVTEPPVTEPEPIETTAPRGTASGRTTAPGGPVTTAPVVTAPTTAPPVVITEPPVTIPTTPATTAPVSCNSPTPKAVGRNVIYYRACTDGLRFSSAVPQSGWSASATAKGPPSVSVTFSNGSTSVTCTLTADSDGVVNTSGDC